jgi:hypothetical protein
MVPMSFPFDGPIFSTYNRDGLMVNKWLATPGAHRTEDLTPGVLVELGAVSRLMQRLVVAALLFSLMGVTEVAAVEEIKKDNIGPWEIEATFKDNKFDHCSISRKVDEVVASFLRTSDGLTLTLESPNWKLERGKTYPVRMKAGAVSWNTDVAAEPNSVSVAVTDTKFKAGLRAASALAVEGAGATIRIPLDQSRAALERLDRCLTKNSRAVETNPFVAPPRQP